MRGRQGAGLGACRRSPADPASGRRAFPDRGRRHGPLRSEARYDIGRDIGLFLFGSPWAALALQRGLLPLHASAVSRAGTVHAFNGVSGAGKSTLAAALGGYGLPFFVDDLLLLDPASDGAKEAGAGCYGGTGLKLFPDALALTDATPGALVCEGLLKRWARPAHRSPRLTGRLRTLHVLSYRDGGTWGCRTLRHRAADRPARDHRPVRRPLPEAPGSRHRRAPAPLRVAADRRGPARAGVDLPPAEVGAAVRAGRGAPGRCAHRGDRRDAVNAGGPSPATAASSGSPPMSASCVCLDRP